MKSLKKELLGQSALVYHAGRIFDGNSTQPLIDSRVTPLLRRNIFIPIELQSAGKTFNPGYDFIRATLPRQTISIQTMGKLTKRDIVVAISNQTGMVQHQVFDVVQRTLDHITGSLANNVTVELRNFGVFQTRLTKPRVGRNPNQPGSSFVIPPRATVKFKAGKVMRQRVEKLSRELKEAADRRTQSAGISDAEGES
ncbi:MAG: HU family DNA-binding protein [Verrucomicrobiota bacterium]